MYYNLSGEEDKFYSITGNYSVFEYKSLAHALKDKAAVYIVKDQFRGSEIFPGNTSRYRLSEFLFYNKEGQRYIFEKNGWKLLSVNFKYVSCGKTKGTFTVRDPENKTIDIPFLKLITRKYNSSEHNLHYLIHAIRWITKYSRKTSFLDAFFSEYKDLQERNEYLNRGIRSYREKFRGKI